jgi:hypothetical protein
MRLLLVSCLSFLLMACVSTYKPANEGVAGFRDLRVDKTTYYVEYTESSRIDWEQLNAFALKRCAEIAKEQGYPFFDVISKDEKTVFLKSNVDEIEITTQGSMPGDPPITHKYKAGARVEGRRVTYKIKLVKE